MSHSLIPQRKKTVEVSLATGESHFAIQQQFQSKSHSEPAAAWFYTQCSLCHCTSLFQDGCHHPLAAQQLGIGNTDGLNHPVNQCSPYPLGGPAPGFWSQGDKDIMVIKISPWLWVSPHRVGTRERKREVGRGVHWQPTKYCGYLPYCWLCWAYCQGSGAGGTNHTGWAFQCFTRICHWHNVQLSGESLPSFPEETERLFLLRNRSLLHPIS